MTVQTNYRQNHDSAFAGMIADLGPKKVESFVNISSKQTNQWVITAVNDTDYFINANGVPAKYTSDLSATPLEIQAGIVAAALATTNPFFAAQMLLTANADPTRIDGAALKKDIVVELAQDANLANTQVTPGGANMPFGRIAAYDPTPVNTAGNPRGKAAKLPDAIDNVLLGGSVHSHTHSVRRGYNVPFNNELHNGQFSFGGADDSGIIPSELAGILVLGWEWIEAEQSGLLYTKPFVRYATGSGGKERGRIRGDADTATAVQMVSALVTDELPQLGLALVQFGITVAV